jgi:hypothetical protein
MCGGGYILCTVVDESYKKVFWGFHNNCDGVFTRTNTNTFRELGLLEEGR